MTQFLFAFDILHYRGNYQILYVARDDAGNIGLCQFEVTVSPRSCVNPGDPYNGNATIIEVEAEKRSASLIAFLNCAESHLFTEDVPEFFTCDVMASFLKCYEF